MTYWLGIDSGGTFIKAALYREDGGQAALARRHLPVISKAAGEAERDPAVFWQTCADVIAELTAQVSPEEIAAVGISAQGKGLFTLDRQGRPLGNGILSSDQRALPVVKAWQAEGIPEILYPQTRQTLWTGHPVSILRALKIQDRARYDAIGSILMSHDYLRYCLTGGIACELTNISESNLYHFSSGTYDSGLAALLDISEIFAALPPIVGSTETAGHVTAEAARLTGLQEGTPVVGGLFDVVSTAVCAGLEDERMLNTVLGTWSVVSGFSDHIDESAALPFVYGKTAQPRQYIIHEASPTSAANLQYFLDLFADQDMTVVNKAVEALPKAESSVLFVPFLYGSNAGLGMQAGLYGLQSYHQKPHIYQAVYEGVLFCLMHHLERMAQRFPKVTQLRVTGGPTRSAVWMQMLADLTGKTVNTLAIEETGCLGAALAAMVGTGQYDSMEQARNAIATTLTEYTSDPQAYATYQKKYRCYQEFVSSLQRYNQFLSQ